MKFYVLGTEYSEAKKIPIFSFVFNCKHDHKNWIKFNELDETITSLIEVKGNNGLFCPKCKSEKKLTDREKPIWTTEQSIAMYACYKISGLREGVVSYLEGLKHKVIITDDI